MLFNNFNRGLDEDSALPGSWMASDWESSLICWKAGTECLWERMWDPTGQQDAFPAMVTKCLLGCSGKSTVSRLRQIIILPYSVTEFSVFIWSIVSSFGSLGKDKYQQSNGESPRWLETLITYWERVKKHGLLSMEKTRVTKEESNFSLSLPREELQRR